LPELSEKASKAEMMSPRDPGPLNMAGNVCSLGNPGNYHPRGRLASFARLEAKPIRESDKNASTRIARHVAHGADVMPYAGFFLLLCFFLAAKRHLAKNPSCTLI
jgi:hypothetical protein